LTRVIRKEGSFYDSLSLGVVPEAYRPNYQVYRKMKKEFNEQWSQAHEVVDRINRFESIAHNLVSKIGKTNPTKEDFQALQLNTAEEKDACALILDALKYKSDYNQFVKELDDTYNHFKGLVDYALNLDYDPRMIVGDDYDNVHERFYGNSDVYGPYAAHGTHVAGIIGAIRDNEKGTQGVADNVSIMPIRVVPDGDERDKDIANAIRYAVDNGAKIINMSFGKPFSPDKKTVDEAVKYAMVKGVLIIHAAGNDGKNLDDPSTHNFPNRWYADSSGEAESWLEVGASGWKNDSTLLAPFSNYGKTKVDVFAPGMQIYSTVPGSNYANMDGTSMAAPVVTGLAALIMEYYPQLKASQVKDIILRSVVKVNHSIQLSSPLKGQIKMPFSEICVSGGVINAYNAIKLAATIR